MSGIRSTYLLQRSDDESLSLVLCVRDGDPDGRRHFSGSVALGGSAALVQYSPTRRDDFVRCDSSGARPERTLGGEGRGWYAGASAYGLHSQYAQNGGWSYGGSVNAASLRYDSKTKTLSGGLINNQYQIELLKQMDFNAYKVDDNGYKQFNKLGENKDGEYRIGMHGSEDYPLVVSQYDVNKKTGKVFSAEELYNELIRDPDFQEAKVIRLVVCYGGKNHSNGNFAQNLANLSGKTIVGSNRAVYLVPFLDTYFSFGSWKEFTRR